MTTRVIASLFVVALCLPTVSPGQPKRDAKQIEAEAAKLRARLAELESEWMDGKTLLFLSQFRMEVGQVGVFGSEREAQTFQILELLSDNEMRVSKTFIVRGDLKRIAFNVKADKREAKPMTKIPPPTGKFGEPIEGSRIALPGLWKVTGQRKYAGKVYFVVEQAP